MKTKKAPKKTKPWIGTLRRESGLIENICKHGVGHPAFGSMHWLSLQGHNWVGIHGCDGCCSDPQWQLEDAREGCRIANKLLFDAMKRIKKQKMHIADTLYAQSLKQHKKGSKKNDKSKQ